MEIIDYYQKCRYRLINVLVIERLMDCKSFDLSTFAPSGQTVGWSHQEIVAFSVRSCQLGSSRPSRVRNWSNKFQRLIRSPIVDSIPHPVQYMYILSNSILPLSNHDPIRRVFVSVSIVPLLRRTSHLPILGSDPRSTSAQTESRFSNPISLYLSFYIFRQIRRK